MGTAERFFMVVGVLFISGFVMLLVTLMLTFVLDHLRSRATKKMISEREDKRFVGHIRRLKEDDAANSEMMDDVERWGNELGRPDKKD